MQSVVEWYARSESPTPGGATDLDTLVFEGKFGNNF